jgi:hypothetical protein
MVVNVVMSPAVYQLILERWRAEFLAGSKDLLAESWGLGLGY